VRKFPLSVLVDRADYMHAKMIHRCNISPDKGIACHRLHTIYAGTSVSSADSGKNSRKHPRWPSNPQQKNYTILDLAVRTALTCTDNKVTASKFIQSEFPRVASLENSSLPIKFWIPIWLQGMASCPYNVYARLMINQLIPEIGRVEFM